jgi:hypothetical protein
MICRRHDFGHDWPIIDLRGAYDGSRPAEKASQNQKHASSRQWNLEVHSVLRSPKRGCYRHLNKTSTLRLLAQVRPPSARHIADASS